MAHTDRPADRRSRPPAPVLLVVAVVALQALVLGWLAVDALSQLGTGVLSAGAGLFLAGIYVAVAVWVGAAALGVARGRAWSRGAVVAIELFGVLLASWLLSLGACLLVGSLLVLSGAALVAVFTGPVTRHLGGGAA